MKWMRSFGGFPPVDSDIEAVRVQEGDTFVFKLRTEKVSLHTKISLLIIDGAPAMCVIIEGDKANRVRSVRRLEISTSGESRNTFFHGAKFVSLGEQFLIIPLSSSKGKHRYALGNSEVFVEISSKGTFLVIAVSGKKGRVINSSVDKGAIILIDEDYLNP